MGYLLAAALLGASLTVAIAWLAFHDLPLAFLLASGGASISVAAAALVAPR